MKRGFYRKLAWSGIRKNKKLYTPYILTCMGMVMMSYIVSFLSGSSMLEEMRGGRTMRSFLEIGFGVMCVFAPIFLFYTNSFLIRRRKKEFGLYNILGMGKRHLALVLLWEALFIALISLAGGLFFGILFSKFAELGMVRILDEKVSFSFAISFGSVWQVIVLFAITFALIFLNTLRQIHLSNPIALLHSENFGEKPPKANWFIALLGAVILAAAYYLAVTIQEPIIAISLFFVAVIMVIVATYMLFISGSVTFCRLLQKSKTFYYKTNHFISVSSMVYRMKRNGAGLASICILCTMVLVMMSSTFCLYIGTEESLRTQYPRNVNLDVMAGSVEDMPADWMEQVRQVSEEVCSQHQAEPSNILDYRVAAFAGYLKGKEIVSDHTVNPSDIKNIWQFFIVPIEDYNRLMGTNETLSSGEAIVYTTRNTQYTESAISVNGSVSHRIKKQVENFADNGVDAIQMFPSMYLFVSDFDGVAAQLLQTSQNTEGMSVALHWYYGFDLSCDDSTQRLLMEQLLKEIDLPEGISPEGSDTFRISCESVAEERDNFYATYGGLFFLGILLGIVFIFAAVLIIYYKQISEGYEDQARFDIMQKVGLTRREIRKSINSQILMVFSLPLLTAGLHLAFAFPMIQKVLLLFELTNYTLLVMVTIGSYLVFGLFYVLVYRITSRSYFSIVSGMRGDHQ